MTRLLLIPAYNPDRRLIPLIRQIHEDFECVIIVNDGSAGQYDGIFTGLTEIDNVVILTHEKNLGKGAALKTGFSHIMEHFDDCSFVVTADADGQHSPEDILAVATGFDAEKPCLVMGSRCFDSEVPLRSRFGNRLTRSVMKFFFRIDLSDTQTGLRAIPFSLLPQLAGIAYNGYEFEVEMLLTARKEGLAFKEIEIDTIYENNNAGSSFNPVVDSAKIYFVLFRYIIASLVTAAVDYFVFFASHSLFPKIFLCTYLARSVALFVNFVILRKYVFHSRGRFSAVAFKYCMIVAISGFVSSVAIEYFHNVAGFNIVLSKITAELLLYLIIFVAQKEFVFRKQEK